MRRARGRARPPPARRAPGPGQDIACSHRGSRARGAVRAHRRPGARAQGRRRRVPDGAGATQRVLRGRDPPPAARARGDVLSGHGGSAPADHDRPGSRGARGHAGAAAVHADRRHHAHGAADHAAARSLRDPGPPGALLGGGARGHRAPLRGHPRGRAGGAGRADDRRAQQANAARCQSAAAARARFRGGAPRGCSHGGRGGARARDAGGR